MFDWSSNYKGVDASSFDLLRRISKRLNQRKKLFRFVEKFIPLNDKNNRKILEVACGMGIEANLLSVLGYEVYGIDREQESIAYASRVKSLLRTDMEIMNGDAYKLDFPGSSFNFVYSQGFLEHFSDSEVVKLIVEQIRVLKPGGYILIDVPNKMSSYNLYKRIIKIIHGEWFFGFERSFSYKMICDYVYAANPDVKVAGRYGWSFYGYPVKKWYDYFVMLPLLVLRQTAWFFDRGQDSVGVYFRLPNK